MFEKFRKSVDSKSTFKKWFAISLLIAIAVVFIFFGLKNQPLGAGGVAAEVNRQMITNFEVQKEAQSIEQMYAPFFGGQGIDETMRQRFLFQALDQLISKKLIDQTTAKQKIIISDEEVFDAIKNIPNFQKEGQFSRELYYSLLEANRLVPGAFEQQIRNDLSRRKIQRIFESISHKNTLEQEKWNQLSQTKINVEFLKFDRDTFLAKHKTTEPESAAFLAKPEGLKKAEEYYANNKAEFQTEEQVKAQHILVKAIKGDAASEKKALQKITELKTRSKTEDFGKLAKEFSEDEGSKVKNGDLGFFGRGRMVPEFEQSAFSQTVGSISEPIKSEFGYHLIKVNEKRPASNPNFSEVKDRIAQKLVGFDKFEAFLTTIRQAVEKNDLVSLDKQIKENDLKWDETGIFDLSQDSIPKLFSEELSRSVSELKSVNELLPRIVKESNSNYVLKLKSFSKDESIKSTTKNLEQDQQQRAGELFTSWIESLKKSATVNRSAQFTQSSDKMLQ